MQIVLIKDDKLYKYPFPTIDIDSYSLKDIDENYNERDLVSIEKKDNSWILKSNDVCKVFASGKELAETSLVLDRFYYLRILSKNKINEALLYVCEENDMTFTPYKVVLEGEYTMGSDSNANIFLGSSLVSPDHAILSYREGKRFIENKDTKYGMYINDIKTNSKEIINGDVVFIMGYKLIFLNEYIIINNFNNGLKINSQSIVQSDFPVYKSKLLKTVDDDNAILYSENDYYSRSPRFITSIVKEDFKIESPPSKVEEDKTPVLYTVGPMLTMAMSSIVTMSATITNMLKGDKNISAALPTLLVAFAMITSTLLWPTLMKKYNSKKTKAREKERQTKYIEYLTDKRRKIESIRVNQKQILLDNYPDPNDLGNIILNRKRNLWQKQIESEDFLDVRVGIGTVPLQINLSYPSEDFSMSSDELKDELEKVAKSAVDILDSPVSISLTSRNKLVVIGEQIYRESMLKSMVMQLATYQSYADLKLVFMISDTNSDVWDSFKTLPHTWSDSRNIRFFANNYDDMTKVSFYLEQVYMSRKYQEDDGNRVETTIDYKSVRPYYLIIVDNIKKNKNVEIISKVLSEKRNLGFGLIILNDNISNLPNACNDFVMASGQKSAVITNDLNKNNQQGFTMDNIDNLDIDLLCERLANIPLKMPIMLDEMKEAVGFLEMYKVGKIEQLNILDRWKKNNPVNSLSVPIGIHTDGEIFNLDLHEKFHGPHGLIAGMTGSGKSEFIITYMLSMCLNFSPEEVSFVLIDYKGGGLTGAFENKLTGVVLPHLAGTITNLDKAEISRSLASIQSELKRRQILFNEAKLALNESTLDIYKYQKLTRDGKIKEPISHLFIITDEFAELKTQQRDFMDELISTARIGRSLGVHLILATQKPGGIVDDQIWSNSKFKVCLKVQEKSDSMDVIKCPDAATLKKAGRFYLQVGYNDYFAMGQAAYAGVKYIPKEKITKTVDRNLSFINDIGDTIKSVETSKENDNQASLGEELINILKYIYNSALSKGLKAKKLWLDKIPEEIFINDLMEKYNFVPKKWDIRPIIGEYDDPSSQRQDILTLNFNETPNTLIYGAPGSGTEIMLSSIIYSLIISHSSEEINIYMMDFGSEMFGVFKGAPQVGDVVFINEQEKFVNLLNAIYRELEFRKKLFVDYNGDYNLFIKNSGKTLPRIIVFINNYEVFNENYEDYVDLVSSLTREGERYGISFVITATGVNAVRGKTSQNFSHLLCLQFNDPTDYSSILGSTRGMVPSENVGRGLIKIDGEIYEYQTAYPYKWDEINVFIKNVCAQLSQSIKQRASSIRVLPDHVRLENVESHIDSLKNVPIGIEKDTLKVSTFNFNKNPISLISTQDTSTFDKFIPSLVEVLQKVNNTSVYVFDTNEIFKKPSTNYFSTNYDEIYNTFEKVVNNPTEHINVFVIMGFDSLINGFGEEKTNKFKSMLSNLKNTSHVKIVLAEDVSKLKNLEYEEFYKFNTQTTYAVWAGSGITDQFSIKCITYNKVTRSQLENEFGFNINRGNATLVKLLDFYTQDL